MGFLKILKIRPTWQSSIRNSSRHDLQIISFLKNGLNGHEKIEMGINEFSRLLLFLSIFWSKELFLVQFWIIFSSDCSVSESRFRWLKIGNTMKNENVSISQWKNQLVGGRIEIRSIEQTTIDAAMFERQIANENRVTTAREAAETEGITRIACATAHRNRIVLSTADQLFSINIQPNKPRRARLVARLVELRYAPVYVFIQHPKQMKKATNFWRKKKRPALW